VEEGEQEEVMGEEEEEGEEEVEEALAAEIYVPKRVQ